MKLNFLFLLACLASGQVVFAQLHTGFKVGWNSASVSGPSETDAAGTALERWETVGGFHIGMTETYRIDRHFAVRAELLYTKKGGKYLLESSAKDATLRFFPTPTARVLTYSDKVSYLINISNGYLDLPVVGSARFGNFEVHAGLAAGLLLSSTGQGALNYSGHSAAPFTSVPTGDLEFLLDYNYLSDKPAAAAESNSSTINARLNNQTVALPKTIGAYYDYDTDKGHLFNSLNFMALGGVSYYLSHALYASVRLEYGLSDLTNNNADISRTRLDGNTPALQTDVDRAVVWEFSVGFSL